MDVIIHYNRSHEEAERTAQDNAKQLGARCSDGNSGFKIKSQIVQMKQQLESLGMLPDISVNNAGIAHYGMLIGCNRRRMG